MKQVDIKSVEELLESLNSHPNHYIYRGHADAEWRLESSLERLIGMSWSSGAATKFENRSLTAFQSKFHLYDHENVAPESKLAWLSIMQHYGVPTRLIDFTESPYVALYFALEAYEPRRRTDFAIFAIDYTAIMQESINFISEKDSSFRETRESIHAKQDAVFNYLDSFAYDLAWVTEPRELNARLDRQAGSFLLSLNRSRKIEEVLNLPIYSDAAVIKYRIPNRLYTGLFALLRKMNLTSKSLYGDLGGLAHSIKMELQVFASPDDANSK
jgi:hypothetical protein